MNFKLSVLILSATLALTACGKDTASTPENANNAIKDRQNLMRDWRGANDIIKGMAENPTNFDTAVLKEQATFMNDSTAKMWEHFKDTTPNNKTNEAIGADPEGFKKASDDFDALIAELQSKSQTASSIADVEPLIGKINESCGACHKAFKKK